MANSKCLFSCSSNYSISQYIFPKVRNTHQNISASSMSANYERSIPEELKLIYPAPHNTYVTNHCSFTDGFSMEHELPLNDIKRVLREYRDDPFEGLFLIDALQRLSIDYHFQEEIEDALHCQHKIERKLKKLNNYEDELYEISTRFRLLRQEGYNVKTDVFGKFMDKKKKLNIELSTDVRGLMSLYEASQLSMEGEYILDHAGELSARLLNTLTENIDHHQARILAHTLQHPCHKSLARLMAKKFISDHKYENRWVHMLQRPAEIELNFVQAMHKKEMIQVSEWWKNTGLATELKFARDQPLKWHMWAVAGLASPSLSEERVDLTKAISFIYLIDDIFDVYGTLDELTLFTEAVHRWDLAAFEQLPDYMKFCFKALVDITNEISYKIYEKHGYNPVDFLRKTWANLCDAFLVEAKWFASGQLPRTDDYLKNGIISSGVHIPLVLMFFLLGQGVNNKSVNLLKKNPRIITYTATILRLSDDLGSAKDENQDGQDGSYIDCYMKDTGYSAETARNQITKMISESWKQLNKEALTRETFPANFRNSCLNITRMVQMMYSYDENSSLPILEEHMKSILSNSITPQVYENYTSNQH